MLKKFENYFRHAVYVKTDDVVGIKPGCNCYNRDTLDVSIILLRGGHEMQVRGSVDEVLAMLDEA